MHSPVETFELGNNTPRLPLIPPLHSIPQTPGCKLPLRPPPNSRELPQPSRIADPLVAHLRLPNPHEVNPAVGADGDARPAVGLHVHRGDGAGVERPVGHGAVGGGGGVEGEEVEGAGTGGGDGKDGVVGRRGEGEGRDGGGEGEGVDGEEVIMVEGVEVERRGVRVVDGRGDGSVEGGDGREEADGVDVVGEGEAPDLDCRQRIGARHGRAGEGLERVFNFLP